MNKIAPLLIFFLGVVFLSLVNWQPGTFLTGGDNLHPEFDFNINIKRSLFAVWQEYQGLGLLGGMGYASDLVRQVFLLMLALVFPTHALRYVWTFGMLFLGGLGAYYLTKRMLKLSYGVIPYFGGTFYLLNLATLQAFYSPFEVFTAHFAALPWLFLTTINVIFKTNKRNLIVFSLVLLLSTPAAYVPTLFVTYLLNVSVLILSPLIISPKKINLTNITKILTAIFAINAFWLLPFIYFTLTSADVNLNSKINQMATEDIFLKNKAFGGISDAALLKGFWFNNIEPDLEGNYAYMLEPWRSHMAKPAITVLGYSLFAIVLWGVVTAFRKKDPLRFAFAMLWFFAFMMLVTATPPFSWVNSLLREIPLFNQAFRFPFTKFSILAALLYAVFFAYGIQLILKQITPNKIRLVFYFLALFALIVFMFPIFRGHLFYSKARLSIPSDYFSLFNFFKDQAVNSRIAIFPQYTFWDWGFYSWGYGGSGFLWYGINQPILGQAFDSWSPKNENYYWEISYAIYSRNRELFNNVLQKYHVQWVVVDKNLINPSSPKALYFDELEMMLESSNKIEEAAEFGPLKAYRVILNVPIKSFVYFANTLPESGPSYRWGNIDKTYAEYGDYITQVKNSVYYPFRSLFTGRNAIEREFEVEDRGEYFIFRKRFSGDLSSYYAIIPEFNNSELRYIDPNNLASYWDMTREVYFDGKVLEVKVPKVNGYFSAEIRPSEDFKDCKSENSFASSEIIDDKNQPAIRLQATSGENCNVAYWLPNLSNDLAYLITVKSRNVKGKPLLFWIENLNSRRSDMEVYLPREREWQTSYLIQPPMEKDGQGYTLHFDNISIGREKTVNDLDKITVNIIPYNFLMGIKLENGAGGFGNREYTQVEVNHPNPSFYDINLTRSDLARLGSSTLVLSQGYDKGWKAYAGNFQWAVPLAGEELKDHMLVNNWANGWIVPKEANRIIIVFLPQYLQYFGFGLLLWWIIYLVRIREKKGDVKKV